MDNEMLKAMAKLLDEKLQPIKTDIAEMKTDIAETKIRLEKVESDTNSLRAGQLVLRKEINEVSIKVSQTYDVALDAWGQSTENRELINNF